MTDLVDLGYLAQNGLWLAAALSLPVVMIGGVVSLTVAVLQAATQIQDATLAHLPRFIAVTVALIAFGGWMSSELVAFAQQAFSFSG